MGRGDPVLSPSTKSVVSPSNSSERPEALERPPLRFDALALREIRIPLLHPFAISSGVTTERRILLLELSHPDGPCVWSECVAGEWPDYSPETVDTAWHAIRAWLAPRLLGRDLPHPGRVYAELSRGIRGHLMAKAALEMACWALWAELSERPLSVTLGGVRDRIACGFTLGLAHSTEKLVVEAAKRGREGYRRLKLKVAPGADYGRLAAVREELGGDFPVAADANGAYEIGDADHLARLDALDLITLEQPLKGGDLRHHAELQRRLRTPLSLDESVESPAMAKEMIDLGSGSFLNLKPGRVGGFGPSLAIHALCGRAGIGMWCGGMLESGLGRAYNAALASLPGFDLESDIYPPLSYLAEDIVVPEWRLGSDGTVPVPRRVPGVGVGVSLDRLEALTVRQERLEA